MMPTAVVPGDLGDIKITEDKGPRLLCNASRDDSYLCPRVR